MKLNNKKTIFVGFAFLLICLFWQVYDSIIAKMLINTFGLNQTWSGLVMAIDNILAIILLPIFGALSDKTRTKYGKRTPYIVIGTVVAAILIVCVTFFDNAQLNKVKEEKIGDVITVTVEEDTPNFEYRTVNETEKENSISSFFNSILGKGNEITYKSETKDLKEGDNYFSFTNDDVTYNYLDKEVAVNERASYVSNVRRGHIGLLIGFMCVLCFTLIAMSTFRTPAVSLMPDVTPKPLRSKANAIINLMGSAGGVVGLLLMAVLAKDYKSYTGCIACMSALMIVCLVIFIWRVKEPKLLIEKEELDREYGLTEEEDENANESTQDMSKDVKKSFVLILFSIVFWFMAYNAATSKFSVYAGNILDIGYTMPLLVAQGAAIACYIPVGLLSSKVGRKKTILVGVIILFVAFLLGSFLTSSTKALIYVTMALAGIGWATINVNSYPMVVEMSKGSNIGKYTGIYYTASMAAQIVTPILSGIFMDVSGTMRVLFPYCVFFSACAFVTMMFVRHGDSKPIPKTKVEAFESMDD